MNLERVLCLFVCQFYSYQIERNLVVPKNTPPKKDAGTQTIISILSRNFSLFMFLLYGKIHWCWWKPRLVEVPHVHALASWNVLWTVIFWLINLSPGLISLIFVLDLGLDNTFLIYFFQNYMFPIRLAIWGLLICFSI